MIIEIPNAVGVAEITQITDAVRPFSSLSSTTAFYRDGKTVHISKTPELKEVDSYLHSLFSKIQKNVVQHRYEPKFVSGDSGYEYHFYGAGETCKYHGDGEFSTGDQETYIRYASVVLHLNTVKEGGELVFPNQNKKIKTEAGKIVIFPPYWMFGHYTTPSEEPREVVVTWFIYDGIKAVRS